MIPYEYHVSYLDLQGRKQFSLFVGLSGAWEFLCWLQKHGAGTDLVLTTHQAEPIRA